MPGQADIIFFGHTHLQGGFLEEDGKVRQFAPAYDNLKARCSLTWNCAQELVIDQPRFGRPATRRNWRSSFALDESKVMSLSRFRFYGCPTTRSRQERVSSANLPPRLAMRLRLGR